MVNHENDNNGSQFLITLRESPWFDKMNVVFGQVLKGIEIQKELELIEVNESKKPKIPVVISNCGELKDGKEITFDTPKEEMKEEKNNI